MSESSPLSPQIITSTDHKQRLKQKTKQAWHHLSPAQQKEKPSRIWNKVRDNNESHHKSTIKKQLFSKHMDQLQTKMNKAKETVFSFWTK